MRILTLVENTAARNVRPKHGLSLYIETAAHKLLFDLGPDGTLFQNAEALGVDLAAVDTVVLSHGHFDHGGALGAFLKRNATAKVYVQAGAFEPHYTHAGLLKIPIGLDASLKNHPQVVTLHGDAKPDETLFLFTVPDQTRLRSPMNDVILDKNGKDAFLHEQNLLISEGDTRVLIMGCGHAGVVNIMEKAKPFAPSVCVGGFHLYDPVLRRTAPKEVLDGIAAAFSAYPGTAFYTCHCTGKKAFAYLRQKLPELKYLAGGEGLTVNDE